MRLVAKKFEMKYCNVNFFALLSVLLLCLWATQHVDANEDPLLPVLQFLNPLLQILLIPFRPVLENVYFLFDDLLYSLESLPQPFGDIFFDVDSVLFFVSFSAILIRRW